MSSQDKRMESDWRKFSEMVPMLRERYLADLNVRVVRILTHPSKSETERFWEAMEAMEKEAKTLRWCLDGHSRSKMWMFMVSMIHAGMLKKEDLSQFSPELQEQLKHEFTPKNG
jgi:hypothetical protein